MGSPSSIPGDDPRQIREHLLRSCDIATSHGLPSVVVGLAGPEGDLGVPEFLTFVQSALRVEDAIFRLTRERAVLFLADVNCDQAAEIVQRLASDFAGRFPAVAEPDLVIGTFEVQPGQRTLMVKDVLPAVFPPRSRGPAN